MPPGTSPDLTEAIRGFVAAIDYKDDALLRSRFAAMGAAFADTADKAIERARHWLERARVICRDIQSLEGQPDEQFDELGKSCQIMFDKLQHSLADIQVGWVRLATEFDHEVSGQSELDTLIHDVKQLRDRTLTGWPWTSLGLPPVDRTMIARSREVYARGEGEPIQEWINRGA
jgi:hypothetical protein